MKYFMIQRIKNNKITIIGIYKSEKKKESLFSKLEEIKTIEISKDTYNILKRSVK